MKFVIHPGKNMNVSVEVDAETSEEAINKTYKILKEIVRKNEI